MTIEVLGVMRMLHIEEVEGGSVLCEGEKVFKTPLRDDQLKAFLRQAQDALGVVVGPVIIAPQYYYFQVL